MAREELSLTSRLGVKFYYDIDKLKLIIQELEAFLEKGQEFFTKDFVSEYILLQELKSNNSIEGYDYDLETIEKTIYSWNSQNSLERNPIIDNLYLGYQYILNQKEINKETLKELYSILSNHLLKKEDVSRMGEYYRKEKGYILRKGRLDQYPYETMGPLEIEKHMTEYFEFLNSKILNDSPTEEYIKSQIMHFYFVYIHPYYDLNGRTSRTVSMWYLLNKECYPCIIFNRAINFNEKNYEKAIVTSQKTYNLNYFIEYMLLIIQQELENELMIQYLSNYGNEKLTPAERQTLLYILNMHGNLTIADFIRMYRAHNTKRTPKEIEQNIIQPLIDKNILRVERETQKYLYSGSKNKVLSLKHIEVLKDNKEFRHITCK